MPSPEPLMPAEAVFLLSDKGCIGYFKDSVILFLRDLLCKGRQIFLSSSLSLFIDHSHVPRVEF